MTLILKQHWRLFWLISIVTLLLTACNSYNHSQTVDTQAAQPSSITQHTNPGATPEVVIASNLIVSSDPVVGPNTSLETCPVTQPPDPLFTPPPPYPAVAPYPNEFWYGSETLWTMLPSDGTWRGLPYTDGHYPQKVFWWRQGYEGRTEPEPKLAMTVRRLDAPAPIIEIGPPATNAYHADFNWAMLEGVGLPTLGCWEITGIYEGDKLSFVV